MIRTVSYGINGESSQMGRRTYPLQRLRAVTSPHSTTPARREDFAGYERVQKAPTGPPEREE
jgi:hypothetical protein